MYVSIMYLFSITNFSSIIHLSEIMEMMTLFHLNISILFMIEVNSMLIYQILMSNLQNIMMIHLSIIHSLLNSSIIISKNSHS